MSQSSVGAWRLTAIHTVTSRLRGPLRPKGAPLASEQAVSALADSIVVAVLDRVTAALENEYAPQLHQTAHPADAITKLFELPGHENLDLRRTYDG